MKDIKKLHEGEDYTTYSYVDEEGITNEVEVTGVAQLIIDCLGKALLKKSFLRFK